MTRMIGAFGMSVVIVGASMLVMPAIYRGEAREVLSPLSPGIWLSEYLYPAVGACESKQMTSEEIQQRSYLGTLVFLVANILIYWLGTYAVILLSPLKNRVRLP